MELTFTQAIESITADSHSGAAEIAERAADILLRRATSGEPASPDALRRELLSTGWALILAQTAMAPLVNLVNSVLWKVEAEDTPRGLRQAVHQGELLRTATATHSEAVRRCSSLRGLRIRESCLTQMNSAPDDESSQQVQVQGASTVSTVEPHRR